MNNKHNKRQPISKDAFCNILQGTWVPEHHLKSKLSLSGVQEPKAVLKNKGGQIFKHWLSSTLNSTNSVFVLYPVFQCEFARFGKMLHVFFLHFSN